MTINQLQYFQELAKTGHMGHSAEKLYISQPSLSISIAKLEEELGILLFERKGHRLILTQEGQLFLKHTEQILREIEEAKIHMQRLSWARETKIRLGCISPVMREYFPRQMQDFLARKENAEVEFEFATENTEELVRRLKNGIYDVLLCSVWEDEELRQVPVLSEPLVLISAAGKELPDSWEEVAKLPLIGYEENSSMDQYLRKISEEQGISFRFVYRGPTEAAIASLVEYGFGYAVIPWEEALLVSYKICRRPLPSGKYHRDIYLTTIKHHTVTGAAARFIHFCIDTGQG